MNEVEEDKDLGQLTMVVYLKEEEEWLGVDLQKEEIDKDLYEELKKFLYKYYNENAQDIPWPSSFNNGLTQNRQPPQ